MCPQSVMVLVTMAVIVRVDLPPRPGVVAAPRDAREVMDDVFEGLAAGVIALVTVFVIVGTATGYLIAQ